MIAGIAILVVVGISLGIVAILALSLMLVGLVFKLFTSVIKTVIHNRKYEVHQKEILRGVLWEIIALSFYLARITYVIIEGC